MIWKRLFLVLGIGTNNLEKNNLTNKQLLVKNTFWLGGIEFFSKILLFFITVGLVRYWGSEEFGAFNLSFAYVALFMILSDFGLVTITTREVAKHRDLSEKYLGNLVGLKLALSVLIGILFVVSFLFFKRPVSIQLLVATLIYNLFLVFQNVFIAIFQAWEKMELVFWNRMVFYLGMLVSALLIIGLKGNAVNLVFGYILATVIAVIVGIYQLRLLNIRFKLDFNFKFWKEMVVESLPLLGMTIATVIYANNDTLLIGRYFGNSQVGWYQTAYKILFAFQSINVINNAVFPRIAVLFHENKKNTLKKIIKLIIVGSLLILIPLALAITWQKELIIKLIYGESFVVSAGVMSLLVWSGVINYFRIFVGNLLIIKKKQKIVFWSVAIGTLVGLIINFIFIPKLGFIQAGRSLIISELVILIVMILGLKKK